MLRDPEPAGTVTRERTPALCEPSPCLCAEAPEQVVTDPAAAVALDRQLGLQCAHLGHQSGAGTGWLRG